MIAANPESGINSAIGLSSRMIAISCQHVWPAELCEQAACQRSAEQDWQDNSSQSAPPAR
jgi:hypothetical protein